MSKNKILMTYIIIGAIFVVGFVFVLLVKSNSILKLEKIHVSGNRILSSSAIIALGNIDEGVSLSKIDTNLIEEKILLNSLISNVSVKKRYPDSLSIEVLESNPSILLELINKSYLLDKDAVVMEITENTNENSKFIRVRFLEDTSYEYSAKDCVNIPLVRVVIDFLNTYSSEFTFLSEIDVIFLDRSKNEILIKFSDLDVRFVFKEIISRYDIVKCESIYNDLLLNGKLNIDYVYISGDHIIGKG